MNPTLRRLQVFAEHPLTQLVTGLILLVSGVIQAYDDVLRADHAFRLKVHHGVALFGLIQVLGSIPSVVEGLDHYFRAVEKP